MYRRSASRRQRKGDEGTLKIIDLRFRIDRQAATRRRPPSRRKAVPLFFLFRKRYKPFRMLSGRARGRLTSRRDSPQIQSRAFRKEVAPMHTRPKRFDFIEINTWEIINSSSVLSF